MAASSTEAALETAAITEHPRKAAVRETIRGRLLDGVGWSAVGSVLAQGCSFLTLVLLARVMGRDSFGRFALIQSTLVSLTTVSGLGLGITATKYVSQYRISDPAKAGRILGLSALVTLAAAVCFTIGLELSAHFASFGAESSGDLQACLRISAVYVFFITITSYQVGALAGFEAFRKIAAINTIYGIATLGMSWAFAVHWGLRGAVWGQNAGAVLLWLLYQGVLAAHCRKRRITIRYREAWQERRILLRFAIPAAACGIVSSAATWGANVLLVRLGGFAELAVFSAALSMRSMVLFTPALIVRVTTPLLNNLLASGNTPAYRRVFWSITGVNSLTAILLASALTLSGRQVLQLFGKGFTGSDWLAPLLLGSAVLEVVANNLYQAVFAAGELWRNLTIISFWAAALLVCARIASARFGAAGLAAGYLVAWSISVGLYAAAALRQMGSGRNHAAA